MTGLWNGKDFQNSRQNCSKNKLVRENAVTQTYGGCSLWVMGSWLLAPPYTRLYTGSLCPIGGTFFWLKVNVRVGILLAEIYERIGLGNLSFRVVKLGSTQGLTDPFLWL